MTTVTRLPLPPLELLDELFEIDETSPSGLRRIKSVSNNTKKGDIAGTRNKEYWSVKVRYEETTRNYLTHRIVYAMGTRKNIDNVFIDHIKGPSAGNVLSNLREASHSENARNRIKTKEGFSSKYLGVSWHKASGKWIVRIKHNGIHLYLGTYESEKEAAMVYNQAALRCHGRFASPNTDTN